LEKSIIPQGTDRLLLKTANSRRFISQNNPFDKHFVALTPDGADWIVNNGIKLIGIDYLSIQRFYDGPETHQILLNNGVVILENIDLHTVAPGEYNLICLPLKIQGSEGAPARAILHSLNRSFS